MTSDGNAFHQVPEDKWKIESGLHRRRWNAPLLATGILCLASISSPVLMVVLPKMGLIDLRESQMFCSIDCAGLLVALAFRLVVLLLGSWALFFRRRPRTGLPRINIFETLISALIATLLVSFWLFYASHLGKEKDLVSYKGLVQFSTNLVDSLLFFHYLAVLVLEIRHRQTRFFVKVVRSPDGESRGFAMGPMSVQKAAALVLDKYYSEFPAFNPYLDDLLTGMKVRGHNRPGGGFKMYEIDGNLNVRNSELFWVHNSCCKFQDCGSTVVSAASNSRPLQHRHGIGHQEVFFDHERKAKKREARLLAAAEEAFTLIKRMGEEEEEEGKEDNLRKRLMTGEGLHFQQKVAIPPHPQWNLMRPPSQSFRPFRGLFRST